MIIFESDRIWNESLVCDYFLSDRKKSDQVDQEDCFQIDGESKCRCGVKQFVDSMLKFVMYAVLIFLIATKFGVESSSVAALIASAGVAIGLAVQGSLSNFAGGILILILKPFEVGDYIMVNSAGIEGTVKSIQIFIQE